MTNSKNAVIKIAVALMAELVDAQVSGTCDRFGRGSSSLLQGTNKKRYPDGYLFLLVNRPCSFVTPQQVLNNVTGTLTEA